MERLTVDVREDHLEKLARGPLDGVVELVWNALDADADHVRVELLRTPMDGIEAVRVDDDGHGMTLDEARTEFRSLGGSWKRDATGTRTKGRSIHGSEGKGRWAAFGIPGDRVTWETVAETPEGNRRFTIEIAKSARREVVISEPMVTDLPPGTTVTVGGISDEPAGLRNEDTWLRLTAAFAIHLAKYPVVDVAYDGRHLRPEEFQTHRSDYDLVAGAELGPAMLTVVEWRREVHRTLYLCTPEGMVLNELRAGIQAPGFAFTAYLRWAGFASLSDRLDLAEFDQADLAPVIDEARAKLRDHFGERDKERAASFIETWKAEDVYPYPDTPLDPISDAKRQLFDIVAVQAAVSVNTGDRRSRNLSLRLLKEAVDSGSASLRRVLEEVLDLPREQIDELNELLDHTTLAAVISAAKLIADRTSFLTGLDAIVFDEDVYGDVNERDHLHKIIRGETWIFGDRFSLVVDEGSLTRVLEKHLAILERTAMTGPPVLDETGKSRRVDLMLAGSTGRPTRREHLVVELKRPGLTITQKELTQIEEYAFTVAADDRFRHGEVDWEFVVIGNRMNNHVEQRTRQPHLPPGVSHQRDGLRVVVKTWAEIIDDCKERLKFVSDKLDYLATNDTGLDYLRKLHNDAIPPNLRVVHPDDQLGGAAS